MCYLSAFGQEQFILKGKVFDGQDRPIPIGDVLLFDANKENLIVYTTLVDGVFLFNKVSEGEFWLEVSALGYKKHSQQLNMRENREVSLQLEEEVTELEDVEITALKSPITNANGNLKIDVQNPIFSSIVDPLEVL